MPLPLVSTVLKYIDTDPKNLPLLYPVVKKWSKITLHVLSKNIIIAIGFIIAIVILKAKVTLSNTNKLTLVSKKIMRHCKSDILNVISKKVAFHLWSLVSIVRDNIQSILQKNKAYMLT